MSEVNEGESTRRWAPSRVASAAVLALLVLGGIAYGIYSLTAGSSGPSSSTSTIGGTHLVNPAPQAATNPPTGSSKSSPSKTAPAPSSKTPATSSPSSSSPSSTGASSTGQLTNTGPGDTAFIGFVSAAAIGTILHYSWRKWRQSA